MAALTKDRDTQQRDGRRRSLPVAATTKIHAGAIVVQEAGVAKPGRTALALVAVGMATHAADNTSGTAGDLQVEVDRGVFRFANSAATDAITAAEIGSDCYIVDDQTVAKTDGAGARSKAGTVFDVDAVGVWVEF